MTHAASPLHSQPGVSRPSIIGIAGASGSGKSFLAAHVAEALSATVLSVDSYYHDLSHLDPEERARRNVDHPASIDFTLFAEQMHTLASGGSVAVPVYDFCTHTRTAETHHVRGEGVLIVEGIFALYDQALRDALTLKVFVELESPTCLKRRTARDVQERGRTPESVRRQFRETVLPMYREFIAPTRDFADIVVRGDDDITHSTALVVEALRGVYSGL